jgi:hypothetical protein
MADVTALFARATISFVSFTSFSESSVREKSFAVNVRFEVEVCGAELTGALAGV